jgi:hypothetical protein
MHSIHQRGVTVVTVFILIFTPMLRGHHWVEVLTGMKVETHTEQCQQKAPCPAFRLIVKKVVLGP